MSEKKVPQAPTARNVFQRIAAVMRDVRGVAKSSNNQQNKYRYAGHESVTEALRGAYVEHGLVRTASVTKCEIVGAGTVLLTVEVSWINADDPNDRHTVSIPGLQGSTQKNGLPTPMQVGMALSYAVKNAEFKTFSLTGDDSLDSEDDRAAPRDEPFDPADDYRDWNGEAVRGDELVERKRGDAGSIATAYLARFSDCRTEADVKALKAEVLADWDSVRSVRNFSDALVQTLRKTRARVRGVSMREPGED